MAVRQPEFGPTDRHLFCPWERADVARMQEVREFSGTSLVQSALVVPVDD
jgi:hypothetical protein